MIIASDKLVINIHKGHLFYLGSLKRFIRRDDDDERLILSNAHHTQSSDPHSLTVQWITQELNDKYFSVILVLIVWGHY